MGKRRPYTEEFKRDTKEFKDELRETKLERDILKKVVGIFSKKPK